MADPVGSFYTSHECSHCSRISYLRHFYQLLMTESTCSAVSIKGWGEGKNGDLPAPDMLTVPISVFHSPSAPARAGVGRSHRPPPPPHQAMTPTAITLPSPSATRRGRVQQRGTQATCCTSGWGRWPRRAAAAGDILVRGAQAPARSAPLPRRGHPWGIPTSVRREVLVLA